MTNPKDAIGITKGRMYSAIPANVEKLVSLAFAEGAMKYGRHNWRYEPITASVYYDAVLDHIKAHWEGERMDPDSGLPHLVKAIAGLFVWVDTELSDQCNDDRPKATDVAEDRLFCNKIMDRLRAEYPAQIEVS